MPNRFDCWDVTHTDTFGGEANYSWINRSQIITHESLTRVGIIRRAKAELGWSGLRCDVQFEGDGYTIHPRGLCQVAFVSWAGLLVDDCEDIEPESCN